METNYPAVICQGKQQRGSGGPGQAGDKQPSQATLFMAFLCISVFIWTFLSWRAGLLPSCMPQHLHSAGYLPLGLLGRELALAWVGTAMGTPRLGSRVPPGTSRALASLPERAGWECQGKLLIAGGWGSLQGAGGHPGGQGMVASGDFAPMLPQLPALAGVPRVGIDPTGESPAPLQSCSPLPAQGMTFLAGELG